MHLNNSVTIEMVQYHKTYGKQKLREIHSSRLSKQNKLILELGKSQLKDYDFYTNKIVLLCYHLLLLTRRPSLRASFIKAHRSSDNKTAFASKHMCIHHKLCKCKEPFNISYNSFLTSTLVESKCFFFHLHSKDLDQELTAMSQCQLQNLPHSSDKHWVPLHVSRKNASAFCYYFCPCTPQQVILCEHAHRNAQSRIEEQRTGGENAPQEKSNVFSDLSGCIFSPDTPSLAFYGAICCIWAFGS